MVSWSKTISSILIVFFLTSQVFVLSSQADPVWNIQTIDTASVGAGALALDSNGNPHLLYIHYTNNDAYHGSVYPGPFEFIYSSWIGGRWNSEVIPNLTSVYNFVLDSNNNPQILYSSNKGITIDSPLGSNWTTQPTPIQSGARKAFLALDLNGNPSVVYADNSSPLNPTLLEYANWNGENWTIQTVDSGKIGGIGVDNLYLAFDKNNYPIIMYGNETDYSAPGASLLWDFSIKFAFWNGTDWNLQTVVSNVTAMYNMVLDSKGYPHFCFRHDYPYLYSGNDTLFYASKDGSGWNFQSVISNESLGDSYLAFDSIDVPHITYFNDSGLIYTVWNGTDWAPQVVSPTNQTVQGSPIPNGGGQIIIDSHENADIAFGAFPSGYPESFVYFSMFATATEPSFMPTPTPSVTSNTLAVSKSILIILFVTGSVAIGVLVLLYRRHRKTKNLEH